MAKLIVEYKHIYEIVFKDRRAIDIQHYVANSSLFIQEFVDYIFNSRYDGKIVDDFVVENFVIFDLEKILESIGVVLIENGDSSYYEVWENHTDEKA